MSRRRTAAGVVAVAVADLVAGVAVAGVAVAGVAVAGVAALAPAVAAVGDSAVVQGGPGSWPGPYEETASRAIRRATRETRVSKGLIHPGRLRRCGPGEGAWWNLGPRRRAPHRPGGRARRATVQDGRQGRAPEVHCDEDGGATRENGGG